MRHALAFFLIVIVPIWDAWYTRRLRRSTDPGMKVRVYLVTMGWVWAVSALVWWTERPGFFFPLSAAAQPSWMPGHDTLRGLLLGGSFGFAIALMMPVILTWRSETARKNIHKALAKLAFFLPVTARERWLFVAVSLTAGICEETLYRGFLIRYFGEQWHLGIIAVILLSSFVFGIGHEYQGIKGMVLAGVLGAVFAVLYVVTGSLLWSMVLHTVVDLRILLFPPEIMTPAETAA